MAVGGDRNHRWFTLALQKKGPTCALPAQNQNSQLQSWQGNWPQSGRENTAKAN